MIPTKIDPTWKPIRAATVLDFEGLFSLTNDFANYSKNTAPLVVLAQGQYYVAPKSMWAQGREACVRLTWCRHPQLGRAALKNWISTILLEEEAVEDTDEEENETAEEAETEEAATLRMKMLLSGDETDASRSAGKNTASEECEQMKVGEPAGDDSLTQNSETPKRDTRKQRKINKRLVFLKRWRIFCRTTINSDDDGGGVAKE